MSDHGAIQPVDFAHFARSAASSLLRRQPGILVLLAATVGCAVIASAAQFLGGDPLARSPAQVPGPAHAPPAVPPVDRVQVALPEEPSAPASPSPAEQQPGPDEVVLPTIDDKPLDQDQQQFLRMLARAMADAGLSCSMPRDLSRASWELLQTWTSPLRNERGELEQQSQKLVSDAVSARLQEGRYELRDHPPVKSPPGDYVGWRHATDARGRNVVHFVRIGAGELPKADSMRERCSAIDRDMASLARHLFDRLSK
ncbi:MAG TPA: hypothetical protein VF384_20100 [Planctomycetota bacterium]